MQLHFILDFVLMHDHAHFIAKYFILDEFNVNYPHNNRIQKIHHFYIYKSIFLENKLSTYIYIYIYI